MDRSKYIFKEEVIHPTEKVDKVLLWDADSLIYHALASGKNEETGEKNPEYEEKDLELVQWKLTEMIQKNILAIEEYYNVLKVFIFIKGKDNFRKKIYPDYKANRPEKHPLSNALYDYITIAHGAISANEAEAEDYCMSYSKKLDHNGIILYIDHDLEEVPSLLWNYQKQEFIKITEKQAIYNLYKKLCLSEPGDNVKTSPGIGIKYFEKNFSIDFTTEQYEEALWNAYLKAWKNNTELAKKNLKLAKEILPLKDIFEEKEEIVIL